MKYTIIKSALLILTISCIPSGICDQAEGDVLPPSTTPTITQDGCHKPDQLDPKRKLDVFYINLDRSIERRKYMEDQLRFYDLNHTNRVRAVTMKDIVVPPEISVVHNCLAASDQTISTITKSKLLNSESYNSFERFKQEKLNHTLDSPYKFVVTELCGRPKNTRKELVVTISHLQAIREAVYSKSECPYALVLEDDTKIAFQTDFMALGESAPKDFGMLQLVTSNEGDVKALIAEYSKDKR